MSKLFLLISLISFISIKAFSGAAEDNIKYKCRDQNGGYNGDINSSYQKCLRFNGVIAVNRNLDSNDTSKGDARLCYIGNPVCASCLQKYGNGTPSQARTGVTQCLQANEEKVARENAQEKERQRELERKRAEAARQAEEARSKHAVSNKQASPPPEEPVVDEIVVTAPRVCSKNAPAACKTQDTCRANNGVWDDSEKLCSMANCPAGTTEDFENEANNICTCNSDRGYAVERGSAQKCPSQCSASNNMEYNMIVRSCVCKNGFEDPTGTMASCVAKNSTPPPTTNTVACLRELQEKVKNCSKNSTSAVDKCDGQKKGGNSDTIDALQALLVGGSQIMGASDNCGQTALAGSTAYAAIEQARNSCDTEISACKSSCDEAKTMLANKESIYQACRTNAWDDHACAAPGRSPYRAGQMPSDQPAFNTEYDSVNRGPFESQIQEMQVAVNQDNAKCDSGGTALVNREGLSNSMDKMNTVYKSASSCECQLSAGGSNCNNIVGPAECAANPSLAGCVKATINCLSATDNSPKCLCFKDPNSDGCKNIRTATIGNGTVNGFAGGVPGAPGITNQAVNGTNLGGATSNASISLGSQFSNSEIKPIASGTETSAGNGNSSPFGSATSPGGGGLSGSGGSANANANSAQAEDPEHKGIKGFFEIAKGALGNLFKKGSTEKSSADYSQQFDANGNAINSKKWRPRGLGRGVAGANEEIGGKFEDIWKVMNKQYKVQDQKDNFIFGGEKN